MIHNLQKRKRKQKVGEPHNGDSQDQPVDGSKLELCYRIGGVSRGPSFDCRPRVSVLEPSVP